MMDTRSDTTKGSDTRSIGKRSPFTFSPGNHRNLVCPPEFKVERSGLVLYKFDLRKVAGIPGGLDYTINLGSKTAYRITCTSSSEDASSWTISGSDDPTTAIARIAQDPKKSSIWIDLVTQAAKIKMRRGSKFNSQCGNGGKKGKLRWRHKTTAHRGNHVMGVDLECTDHKGLFSKEKDDHWAFVSLTADHLFDSGTISIIHCAPSQEALDELIVTGFSMIVLLRRALQRTAIRKTKSTSIENDTVLAQYISDLSSLDFGSDGGGDGGGGDGGGDGGGGGD